MARVAGRLTPSCVWRVSDDLVARLDERFGEPLDAYVNGSQVWMRDDGPGSIMLQWRLHPVPGYRRPDGVATDEVFTAVALALSTGREPPARPEDLWDGLEAFPAYGDEAEPVELAQATATSIGIGPDACGLVDHEVIGDEWERSAGSVSIVDRLLAQLGGRAPG